MPRLILCSASPRRRDLLARLGFAFEIVAPHIDEARLDGEPIRTLPLRLAQRKARAGLEQGLRGAPSESARTIALAADTVVSIGERELSKPRDRQDAREILAALSGHEHIVTTGVCVLAHAGLGEPLARSCSLDTKVCFRAMSARELDWLAASGDGDDKAGGYALQGLASAFIERVEGSFTNVIGLPLPQTLALLEEAGLALPWNAAQAGAREEARAR